MNWYKIAKSISVNRDDNELRLVICPKCQSDDINPTDSIIALACDDSPLKLCQCKKCKAWFAFYREDGLRDVDKEEAKIGFEKELFDMQTKGSEKFMDSHGHSYYVLFKEKPKTLSRAEFERARFSDESTWDDWKDWGKKNLIELNHIVRNKDIISKIDFNLYEEK